MRAALSVAACALGALIVPAVASAAPPVVGVEKPASAPVYQGKPGPQHTAAVAWNGLRNKYVVVWVDGNSIRGEFVSTAGARDAPTHSFTIPTGGSPFDLDIAVQSTHHFLIVWSQGGDVWGARVLDHLLLGDPFVISSANRSQENPTAASNGADFLVVWEDQRRNTNPSGSGFELFAARVSGNVSETPLMDANGFEVASDGGIFCNAQGACSVTRSQTDPTVAWDGSNYLVGWAGASTSVTTTHIRGRFVTSAGAVSGGVFAISDTASPTESEPDLIWNGANSVYFLVWRTASGSGDVAGARVNAAGAVLDSPAEVFADGPGNQQRPRTASNASNSYTIVWDDGADVYARNALRINLSLGTPNFVWVVLDPVAVAAQAGNDVVPALTTGDGTNLLAAWTGGQADVHAKRIAVTGSPVDGAPIVISSSAGPQELPFLAWNGSYLAAWTERRPPTSSSTADVYRGRLNAAGEQLDGSGLLLFDEAPNALRPLAVARGATTFLVTWNVGFTVYAMILDGTGAPLIGPIAIDAPDYNGVPSRPDVAWNGATYLVAWRYYDGGFDQGIRAKRLGESGDVLDAAPILVTADGNGLNGPIVASDGGNWLVAWSQLRPGSDSDVLAKRVNREGVVLDPAPNVVSAALAEQTPTGAAWDGDRYLVAWEDHRDTGFTVSDVYAGRVSEAGLTLDGNGIPVATALGGTGGREADVAANGENFVIAWRTSGNDIRAARMSGRRRGARRRGRAGSRGRHGSTLPSPRRLVARPCRGRLRAHGTGVALR